MTKGKLGGGKKGRVSRGDRGMKVEGVQGMIKLTKGGFQNFRCQKSERNRQILRCVQEKKKKKEKIDS